MENSTRNRLKILRNRSEYIITLASRVVVQKFTEIGSPILGGQIGEVLVFFLLTNTVFLLTNTLSDRQTHTQFPSSRPQITNMDRIERSNAHNTWFQVQMCLLGYRRWSIIFGGRDPQKAENLGAWIGISSHFCKKFKSLYLQNCVSD